MIKITEIAVNLNNQCRVHLTALGRTKYYDHFAELRCPAPFIPDDGWLRMTLWDFAHVFGPHLGNGFPLVTDTEIIIEGN